MDDKAPIEITESMINAGFRVYAGHDSDEDSPSELMHQIYLEMEKERRRLSRVDGEEEE